MAVLAASCLLAAAALAAPKQVESFDPATWARLQAPQARATVVVFTTTDCAHCPAVIAKLAAELRQRRLDASLLAVVMDQGPGEDDAALLADAHYRPADRLLAFAAPAPALRHLVDPHWRGVTPYVVFLVPPAAALAATGPPPAALLQRFAAALAGRPPVGHDTKR